MTVLELIAQLNEAVAEGMGSARVMVTCEWFSLVDMDSDGDVKDFYTVPCTGVEEWGGCNGSNYLVIGREEPDEVRKRMCDSGWWAEVADGDEEATQ